MSTTELTQEQKPQVGGHNTQGDSTGPPTGGPAPVKKSGMLHSNPDGAPPSRAQH